MKSNIDQLSTLTLLNDSTLRLAYKNEEVINETIAVSTEKEKMASKPKLFVTEPLPMFNDYRIKCRTHDPL